MLQKVHARIIIAWLPPSPVIVLIHFWCMVSEMCLLWYISGHLGYHQISLPYYFLCRWLYTSWLPYTQVTCLRFKQTAMCKMSVG